MFILKLLITSTLLLCFVAVIMTVKLGKNDDRGIDLFQKHVISQDTVDELSQKTKSGVTSYFDELVIFLKDSVKGIPEKDPTLASLERMQDEEDVDSYSDTHGEDTLDESTVDEKIAKMKEKIKNGKQEVHETIQPIQELTAEEAAAFINK